MIPTLFCSLLACVAAPAEDAPITPQDNSSEANTDALAEASLLLGEFNSRLSEMSRTLDSVKDRTSADAASVVLERLSGELSDVLEKLMASPELAKGNADHARLRASCDSAASLLQQIDEKVGALEAKDFYGSEALRRSLISRPLISGGVQE